MKKRLIKFIFLMILMVLNTYVSAHAESEAFEDVSVFALENHENTFVEGNLECGADCMVNLKVTDGRGAVVYKDITISSENGKFKFITDTSDWQDGEYTFSFTDEMGNKYSFSEIKPFECVSAYNKVLEYDKNTAKTRIKIKAVTKDEIIFVTYKLKEMYTDEEILIETEGEKLFEIFSEENTVNIFSKSNTRGVAQEDEVILKETEGYRFQVCENNDSGKVKRYYINLNRILNSDSEGFVYIINKKRNETDKVVVIDDYISSGMIIPVDISDKGYIMAEVIINPTEEITAKGNEEMFSEAKEIEITEVYKENEKLNVKYEKNNGSSSDVTVIFKGEDKVQTVAGEESGIVKCESSDVSEIYIWEDLKKMRPLSLPYYIGK